MNDLAILLILTTCAVSTTIMASVMALFARHKVQYLALTWILGIFGVAMFALLPIHQHFNTNPGIAHPLMLFALASTAFLQSIYPLSIPMPAYLQWGRMWKYATPLLLLMAAYGAAMLMGMEPFQAFTMGEMCSHWLSFDMLMRLATLGLSAYYVINILRLPTRLAHRAQLPRYVKGYCTALGTTGLFYISTLLSYNAVLIIIYLIAFTLLNLYLCFRTLETMAMHLPKPTIAKVEKEPQPVEPNKEEEEDFNEANLQRFQRVEYWMQNHREEWTQPTFNRDVLCEQVGLNRHLLLQCVRSQGYNDTHEYLNAYRTEELKRLIVRGQVRLISETIDAGFGTTKTARSVFLKMTGGTLDDFMAEHKKTDKE
ncbi:MAG: hypothetical protein KBT12_00135 [Bacteroidales bacterium]|nr:hypothetical protein [Candidatus Physcousia equi]